jgi:hypothetical protein
MEKVADAINIDQCKACLYRANFKYDVFNCLYILFVGQSRGCEPSPNCTKYKKYNKRERKKLEKNTSSF